MDHHPLHILHTESSEGWGGQEIRILTESAGMIQRGHRVELICTPDSVIYQTAAEYGVPVQSLPMGRKNVVGLAAVRKRLRHAPPQVIVTHSSTDSWLTAVARMTIPGAPPAVRVRHISAPVPRNPPTWWLYRHASRHVITTGERLREMLIQDNRLPPQHVTSVPTGIDLNRFRPGDRTRARAALGLPQEVPLIGIIATLRSWKGHDHLLAAFKDLFSTWPNAHLVVVGDGPRQEAIESQIQSHGIGKRVILAGKKADVVPWMHALDLFVLPSYANEGVPQSLMQAMACGLPVITTPVGSIPEIVIDGKTGVMVPPRAPSALSQAIQELLATPDKREQLGARAFHQAQARFGLENMLDRMEQLLGSVVYKERDV